MQNPLTDATANLHTILEPLSPEDRQRVIQAALVLLGDSLPTLVQKPAKALLNEHGEVEPPSGVSAQAKIWMQKHSLSMELIEVLIHLDDGKATVIELPGKNGSGRERTHVCYLMAGLACLISSGEPSFSDEDARALCVHFGCYDKGNHSFVKAAGKSGHRFEILWLEADISRPYRNRRNYQSGARW